MCLLWIMIPSDDPSQPQDAPEMPQDDTQDAPDKTYDIAQPTQDAPEMTQDEESPLDEVATILMAQVEHDMFMDQQNIWDPVACPDYNGSATAA